MLVTLSEVLNDAPLARMAFNLTSVEGFRVLVEVGEQYEVPLILQVSERYLKDLGPDWVRQLVVPRLEHSANRFVLHLDHAGSLEAIQQGIDWGFTSVMYDGSMLPLSENIRRTQEVLQYARAAHVSVEAEIGHVGGAEDGDEDDEALLTSVAEAEAFCAAVRVDALAVAVGNAHGLYKRPPRVQIDRIVAISRAVGVPLVLHGGTGIPVSDLVRAAQAGIKKINIGTELKQAWLQGARVGVQRYRELDQVRAVIQEHVREAVMQFAPVMGIDRPTSQREGPSAV